MSSCPLQSPTSIVALLLEAHHGNRWTPLVKILSHLAFHGLVVVTQTNKDLAKICDEPCLWRSLYAAKHGTDVTPLGNQATKSDFRKQHVATARSWFENAHPVKSHHADDTFTFALKVVQNAPQPAASLACGHDWSTTKIQTTMPSKTTMDEFLASDEYKKFGERDEQGNAFRVVFDGKHTVSLHDGSKNDAEFEMINSDDITPWIGDLDAYLNEHGDDKAVVMDVYDNLKATLHVYRHMGRWHVFGEEWMSTGEGSRWSPMNSGASGRERVSSPNFAFRRRFRGHRQPFTSVQLYGATSRGSGWRKSTSARMPFFGP